MPPSSTSVAKAIGCDLVAFEILSRLPAKSVLRFKTVCKQWLALASDPFFLAAHTRCNPHTVSGFLIQDVMKGPLCSFSVDGGASPALPNPLLSHLNSRFAASGGIVVWQSSNGLLLCRIGLFLLNPTTISPGLFLLNPTTMQYREIPEPPTDLYPIKYEFMLAFDPSTSFQYRIACISSNVTFDGICPRASELHVEIYSSDTGAWELSRETVPGSRIMRQGAYWNGALNWLTQNGLLVSFDVEKQVVKTTQLPPRDRRGVMLYFGESRGRLHLIESVTDVGSDDLNWLRFHVFEMGKDTPSWSLLYNVDLNGVSDVYPETLGAIPDKNAPRILSNWGIHAVPVFFARGGKGGDDKLYLSDREKIICYNLADRTCRKIFAMNSCSTVYLSWSPMTIECFPFAHSLFSP